MDWKRIHGGERGHISSLGLRKTGHKPSSVLPKSGSGDHYSWTAVTCGLQRPYPGARTGPAPFRLRGKAPLFGLAPGGVYHAVSVTRNAVSSYLAFSPLPDFSGGIFSVALSFPSPGLGITQRLALWCSDFPPGYTGRPPAHLSQNPEKLGALPRSVQSLIRQAICKNILFPGNMLKANRVERPGENLCLFVANHETGIADPILSRHLPDHQFRIRPDDQISYPPVTCGPESGNQRLIFRLVVRTRWKNTTL